MFFGGKSAESAGAAAAGAIGNMVEGKGPRDWLFCIPIQVGPATQYARNTTHWLHAILLLQAAVCVLRLVFLMDFIGGLWMALVCALGWFAWYHDMNITYICSWGLMCLINGVIEVFSLLLPLCFSLLTVSVVKLIIQIIIPCTYLLGTLFAWHLYRDYAQSHGANLGTSFDPLGKYIDRYDPDQYLPSSVAQLGTKRLNTPPPPASSNGPWLTGLFSSRRDAAATAYGAVQQDSQTLLHTLADQNPFGTAGLPGAGGARTPPRFSGPAEGRPSPTRPAMACC